MNRWLALLLALGVSTAACGQASDQGAAATAEAPAAETAEAPAGTNGDTRDIVYVDVRTPEEYAAGHVEGAINIPHTEMRQRYEQLERYDDEQIVVYCRSGRRSGIAQRILQEEGFDNVTNGGGLRDLQAEGVPTTR